MYHAPVKKSYTVRTWQSSYTRLVDGLPVDTVIYSGHNTREEAEKCAARFAQRRDVVSVDVTPVDESYEYDK